MSRFPSHCWDPCQAGPGGFAPQRRGLHKSFLPVPASYAVKGTRPNARVSDRDCAPNSVCCEAGRPVHGPQGATAATVRPSQGRVRPGPSESPPSRSGSESLTVTHTQETAQAAHAGRAPPLGAAPLGAAPGFGRGAGGSPARRSQRTPATAVRCSGETTRQPSDPGPRAEVHGKGTGEGRPQRGASGNGEPRGASGRARAGCNGEPLARTGSDTGT